MLSTQTSSPVINIITKNIKTNLALSLAREMAKTHDPVIIYGANGTGKNLFANYIQQQSPYSSQPFRSLPSSNSIGAVQQLKDCLDEVGTGTLFLAGVQELDIEMQHLLVDYLSRPTVRQKIRLITTTSADLDKLSQTGKFLPELLTTIQGGYIELLPLNERREDISPLVTFYVEHFCRASALPTKIISAELLHILEAYNWPGNVRELVSTVVQLVITAQTKPTLFPKDLPAHIRIQTLESATAQRRGL